MRIGVFGLTLALGPIAGLMLAWPVAAQAPAQEPQVDLISVTFSGAPIEQVAIAFADFADRSIVLGADLTGSVTAIVKDEPWRAAFTAILESQGLRMVELEGGIILVERMESVAAREDIEELVTRIFPIRYQRAAELELTIQAVLSERGRVSVATHSNSLVVTDVAEAVSRVAELLGGAPAAGS